jgi:type IV secretory pathway protease TraF
MKKKLANLLLSFLFFSLGAFFILVLHGVGLRANLSSSLPGLVYRAIPLPSDIPVLRGDRVLIDLEKLSNPVIELGIERGYMSRKKAMLKEIGAVPNDVVVMNKDRLYINSASIPMVIASSDSRGEKLLPYPTPYVLSADSYWLISTPYFGFDSRYFGPLNRNAFTHKARRIF